MDWIFDNLQIVAILALVLGSFVKQFLDAKAEERRARQEMDRNPPENVFGPDEEWEAEPVPAAPPPAQMPPPLRRSAEADEAVLKRQAEMQERLRQAREAKEAKAREAAAFASAVPIGARREQGRKGGLREALSKPGETRRAIVLREILGPPAGLR